MIVYACAGCEITYDKQAYEHHFEHDHCDYQNGEPLAMILCDRHRTRCPLTDPVLRTAQYGPKGWPGNAQRECSPLYVFRGGLAVVRPRELAGHLDDCVPNCVQPHAAGWLTLGSGRPEPVQKVRAPRPPAMVGAR